MQISRYKGMSRSITAEMRPLSCHFAQNRGYFKFNSSRLKTGLHGITLALVSAFPELSRQNGLISGLLDSKSPTPSLEMIEQAFIHAWVAVNGRIDVSLWEMYQVLANQCLVSFDFSDNMEFDERQRVVLNTLGWRQPDEETFVVQTFYIRNASSALALVDYFGLRNGRNAVSFGYGLNVDLELAAAISGAMVSAFDIDPVAIELAEQALLDNPILQHAISASGGRLTFHKRKPDPIAFQTPGNRVIFRGVIDDSVHYKGNDGILAAKSALIDAMQYLGPNGVFVFGITAVQEDSIYQKTAQYLELVRIAARTAGITFATETTLALAGHSNLFLFERG